jgi:hypothetical protein
MSPLTGLTLQMPSPGTVSGSPGLAVPTICTVPGTGVSPVVSFASTGTVTGVPGVLPVELSSLATGR